MLLDGLYADFENAYIESSYYSIKNIFYFLKANKIRLQINYGGVIFHGVAAEIGDDHIRVRVPEFRESQERKAVINFEALNRYYLANVFISKTNANGVFIDIPAEIRYLARRLYPRISFENLFTRFIILYSPILDTRQAEKNMESRYPHFLQEILQDNPSLRIIHKMFTAEIMKISENFSVHMFYNRGPENIMEEALVNEDRGVFIEDVSRLESYIQKTDSTQLTNLKQYYEKKYAELGEYKALLHMEEIKKNDARNFLVSVLLIPIHMFERPIGYFRLESNQFNKHFITRAMAEELMTLSELFSYGVTKIRIRNSHFDPSARKTRVLNISLSGMLMEITDEILYHYLQKHRRIKMMIPVEGRELEIFGEIIRFFPRDGAYYMGVLFFKSSPDDMIRLEKFCYRNLVNEHHLTLKTETHF